MNELFSNILTASFHGSVVILAVIVLRAVLKKTPKKFLCLLWLLAGIRLLMPFEIQSSLSLQPDREQLTQSIEAELREDAAWVDRPDLMPAVPQNAPIPEDVEVSYGDAFTPPAQESLTEGEAQLDDALYPAEPEVKEYNWAALIPYFWLSVASCFAIYSVYSYLRLRYQVREAIKIPGGWECDRIDTAFILGFVKPQIYIPMGMSRSVRKHILAHERTHLEKGDHWFKMIGFIALALHWFNPLVWVAYILLCKDIEMACDERVVQFMDLEERKSYSAALLSCSTNRIHFAACPVAFGEVSVKDRIKSVLNYRKPSFWISLLGVAAICFVAVCLVTSPVEEAPPQAAPAETTASETETIPVETTLETEAQSTFAATLDQSEIVQVCTDAINQLCEQESYLINRESASVYPEREDGVYSYNGTIRRYGDAILHLNYEQMPDGEVSNLGSSVYFGDICGSNWGDYWVLDSQPSENYDVNDWLKEYTPEGKTVTFPEGTGIISDDSVSFCMEWTESVNDSWKMNYSGTITFTFRNDGTLSKISRRFEQHYDGVEEEEPFYFTTDLFIMEEDPQQTYRTISDYAAQCITLEQLDKIRAEQEKITEIPSNKTDYDKDFMLGSGQMRWHYFDKEWQFALGAENATAEGLTLKYCESGDDHSALVAEEGFWIEQFLDGIWIVLDPENPVANAPAEKISVSWTTTDTLNVNWKDSYGTLPHGFYRLGRYHTVTMPDGRTETIHCYAKFRVYDPNQDKLLEECRAALEHLLNSDSFHFYTFDWMTEHDFEYYCSTEVWKAGEDYLEVTCYPLREDLSQMQNVRGSLWREGKHYGVEWEGEPALSPVSQWDLGVDGYITGSNVDIALMGYEWYDAQVEEVYKEGSKYHIIQTYDFDSKYEVSEIILTIEGGQLKEMVRAYLPTRNCADADKVISEELVVFDDNVSEIRDVIYAQDVTTPMPFSYEEDVKNNPNAQKTGFRNTTAKPITTAAEALALADKESTMPKLMEFEGGYCQSMTYYDETAKMWKVHLFWWQHDTAQTVYIDEQGITRMIVSVE